MVERGLPRQRRPEDPDDPEVFLWRMHKTVAIEREGKLRVTFGWMN
jgi:hypothetical protein